MAAVGDLLRAAGIDPREARLLLEHYSGLRPAILSAFPERTVEDEAATAFRAAAARRRAGEPVAYILGSREFYSRAFLVNPDVLIPRPETELLVELALARLEFVAGPARVLDLGTGSGVLAVTLACELPGLCVTAVEASAAALAVARANAARLAPRADIEFVQSDWFDALGQVRYDLIVGNPPYVARDDAHLAQGDLRHEPRGALASGPAGLDAIARIAGEAPHHLQPGAWLLLEHGYEQGAACARLLAAAGLAQVQTWRDLAGLERVSGGVAP
jgi:release factor glutamine methyltransferase